VLVFLASRADRARASDVGDELTLGEIRSGGTATPFWSDRLDGAVDLSDQVALDLSAGLTHYSQSPQSRPGDILQFGAGTSWLVNDHLALDADVFVSPQNMSVERGVPVTATRMVQGRTVSRTAIGAERDKTSSYGFAIGADYDTAGDSDAESAVGLSLAATSYSTTQRQRARTQTMFGDPERASLWQWRLLGSFTETLWRDTDLGLAAAYYFYSRDPSQSGYYGTAVFARSVSDAIPVEPLEFSIRPSVAQNFGPFRLRGYVQYGRYRESGDYSELGGIKAQYKFSHMVRAWLSGSVQRNSLTEEQPAMNAAMAAASQAQTHYELWILWASVGARIVF
jgi:hypothetical protein